MSINIYEIATLGLEPAFFLIIRHICMMNVKELEW